MSYLLDTHVLIWWLEDDPRLDRRIYDLLRDEGSFSLVSVASAWEIAVKVNVGKLQFPLKELPEQLEEHRFELLSIQIDHTVAASLLPTIHRDPFDRMLVAQAQVEGLELLTQDERILQYPGIDGASPWRVMDSARPDYRTRRGTRERELRA